MLKYLDVYRGGLLPSIAKTIGDGGQFINHLAYKFNSDAANWVWNRDTVHAKIDELITEYEIIETSNKVLTKNVTYQETIRAWCSKIEQIRLAFSVIKNELGDARAFYEMLYNLKKANSLLDSQKQQFLALLKDNIENFKPVKEIFTEISINNKCRRESNSKNKQNYRYTMHDNVEHATGGLNCINIS